MKAEDRAKIREALGFYAYPEKSKYKEEWEQDYPGGITYEENGDNFCDTGNIAREALALIEAEDKPSVPMALVKGLVDIGAHRYASEKENALKAAILEQFGIAVKE